MTTEFVHCDDLIDDPSQPECLRQFLRYHRLPAVCQCAGWPPSNVPWGMIDPKLHEHVWTAPRPKLFANHAGNRVRVTMASRFGDVGITTELEREYGYSVRVPVAELSNFSAEPPAQVSL